MVSFTCKKCDTKQSKFFTKKAYHSGVVLVRCDGCHNVHLMADNLGWFNDEKQNIESIMKEKGTPVVWANPDAASLDYLQKQVKETRAKFEEDQKARQQNEKES